MTFPTGPSSLEAPRCRVVMGIRIPMRDGVELVADVYTPSSIDQGPFPVVLQRTPYSRQAVTLQPKARYLAQHGYAVVLQDVRGRHDSGGVFRPWIEFEDGYDTVEWLAAQPWATGTIGMMGGSYAGFTQWAAARERPPHLRTLVASCSGGLFKGDTPYDAGILAVDMLLWTVLVSDRIQQDVGLVDFSNALRHLPLRTADEAAVGHTIPQWQDWIDNPDPQSPYWRERQIIPSDFANIDLPVLHLTAHHDADNGGAFYFYRGMREGSPAAARQQIIVGPWGHVGVLYPRRRIGGIDFGPESVLDVFEIHRRWFDTWLRHASTPEEPTPRAYVFFTGEDRWHSLADWPPPTSEERPLYLHSSGHANTLNGDGVLSWDLPSDAEIPDRYDYDPQDPVESIRDYTELMSKPSSDPDVEPGYQFDQRFMHTRRDVLVYTSAPLEYELDVSGHPCLVMYASADVPDTDFFVALHDVTPGSSTLVSHGQLAARRRGGLDRSEPIETGVTHEFRVRFEGLAHVFLPGHSIRLTVTGSDMPRWARNLNTGEPLADATESAIAHVTLHHRPGAASHVLLGVGAREQHAVAP